MLWKEIMTIEQYCEDISGDLLQAFASEKYNMCLMITTHAINNRPMCSHLFYDNKRSFLIEINARINYFIENIFGKINLHEMINKKNYLWLKFSKRTGFENKVYEENSIYINENYDLESYKSLRKIMNVLSKLENSTEDKNVAIKVDEKLYVRKTDRNKYVFSKTPKMYIQRS